MKQFSSDIDCRTHSDFRDAKLEKIRPWSSLNWEIILSHHPPPPMPFLSYCYVCVTQSKLSLGDTHGINSFHLSFHTWSAAYIPLSPNKMKHTVLVFTWPIPCFLCWTTAMSMCGSGIMPNSKVDDDALSIGGYSCLLFHFLPGGCRYGGGPCSVHIHRGFHEWGFLLTSAPIQLGWPRGYGP